MNLNDYDLGTVRRAVSRRTVDEQDTAVLTISQVYDTDVEDLWDACTSAERIPRWFLPVSGELKLGGHYQLEGNAGGTVERCDPPRSFAATWEYGGEVSWIEVALTAESGRARLTLTHTAPVDQERWGEFGPGAVGIGWDMMLNGLNEHVATQAPVDPEAAMAWMVSPDGARFMTESGGFWRAADVAAGTPVADADAAARRCLAAYTAPPA